MKSFRTDRMPAQKMRRLDNGFVRFDMTVSRSGILIYRFDDGSEWREYRPASEAFDTESIESLAGVPLTNDHPPVLLNSSNTKEYMVGYTGDRVNIEGDFVAAVGTLTDADAIAVMEAGKQEISAGYELELDFTPGVFEGEHYDAIQKNIRYNHVALVDRGRAGPGARVKMDSAESAERTYRFDSFMSADDIRNKKGQSMKTISIDGVDYKVSEELETALLKKLRANADSIEAVKSDVTKATARADALADDLAAEKAKVAELQASKLDEAAINARVDARVKLLTFAKPRLDAATDWATKSDREIKVALIKAANPKFDAEGKDDVYIQARVDHLLETATEETKEEETKEEEPKDENRSDAAEEARKVAANRAGATSKNSTQTRSERMRADAERWKKPIGVSVK